MPLPTDQQLAKLGSPIADVVIGDDAMTQQTQNLGQASAQNGRPDMSNVHRLGDIGRTEIDYDSARLRDRLIKKVFPSGSSLQRLCNR